MRITISTRSVVPSQLLNFPAGQHRRRWVGRADQRTGAGPAEYGARIAAPPLHALVFSHGITAPALHRHLGAVCYQHLRLFGPSRSVINSQYVRIGCQPLQYLKQQDCRLCLR